MNRCILVGLFCARIFIHAIQIMGSNRNLFTIHYNGSLIHLPEQKYNEFINCLCHSNGTTSLILHLSVQRNQIDFTESVKCEMDSITTKNMSIDCILTHTKMSNEHVDISILCNAIEVNLSNINTVRVFTLRCTNTCFGIKLWSDDTLNVTFHDPDTVDIQKEPCVSGQPELIETSTSGADIIRVNYSDIGTPINASTQISNVIEEIQSNVSAQVLDKKSHFTSTMVIVMSAIFIGCIFSFILGVKRISLHSLCLTNLCWVYNKILKSDNNYIRRDNNQEQTFRDSYPQNSESLDQMIDNHTAIWHRETEVFEWRSNGSFGEGFEQETTMNNILVDRVYAVPEISLTLVNALSSETEISENQNGFCNQPPVQKTSQLHEIHRRLECTLNTGYYDVEIKHDEKDITIKETSLKMPAEGDVTTITNVYKIYETPSPIIDDIYFTLRRKSKFFKHNYERIPLEVASYHVNLGQDVPSRLSTCYEIEFAEEERSRKRNHSAVGGGSDDSREFIFDEEIPIFSVYSSLRQKRRYRHNYEIIPSVLDTPDTDKGGETLPEEHDGIDEAKDVFLTIASEDKERDGIKFMIKNDKETNIYSVFKDFSRTRKPNVMNYHGIQLLDISCHPQNEFDLYLQQGADVY